LLNSNGGFYASFVFFMLVLSGVFGVFLGFDSVDAWVSEDGEHVAEFLYCDFDDAVIGQDFYNNSWLNVSNFGNAGNVSFDDFNPSDRFIDFNNTDDGSQLNLNFSYNESLNLTSFSLDFVFDSMDTGWNWKIFAFENFDGSKRPVYLVWTMDGNSVTLSYAEAYVNSSATEIFSTTDYNENSIQDGVTVCNINFEIRMGDSIRYGGSIGDDVFGSVVGDWNEDAADWKIRKCWVMTKLGRESAQSLHLLNCNIVVSNGYYYETFFDDYGNMRSFGTDHNTLQSWADWPNYPSPFAVANSYDVSPNVDWEVDSGYTPLNRDHNSIWWYYRVPGLGELQGIIRNFHIVVQYCWEDSLGYDIGDIAWFIGQSSAFRLDYNGLDEITFEDPVVGYVPNSHTHFGTTNYANFEIGYADLVDAYGDLLYCNETLILFDLYMPGLATADAVYITSRVLTHDTSSTGYSVYDGNPLMDQINYCLFENYDDYPDNYFYSGVVYDNFDYRRPMYYFSWDDFGTLEEAWVALECSPDLPFTQYDTFEICYIMEETDGRPYMLDVQVSGSSIDGYPRSVYVAGSDMVTILPGDGFGNVVVDLWDADYGSRGSVDSDSYSFYCNEYVFDPVEFDYLCWYDEINITEDVYFDFNYSITPDGVASGKLILYDNNWNNLTEWYRGSLTGNGSINMVFNDVPADPYFSAVTYYYRLYNGSEIVCDGDFWVFDVDGADFGYVDVSSDEILLGATQLFSWSHSNMDGNFYYLELVHTTSGIPYISYPVDDDPYGSMGDWEFDINVLGSWRINLMSLGEFPDAVVLAYHDFVCVDELDEPYDPGVDWGSDDFAGLPIGFWQVLIGSVIVLFCACLPLIIFKSTDGFVLIFFGLVGLGIAILLGCFQIWIAFLVALVAIVWFVYKIMGS